MSMNINTGTRNLTGDINLPTVAGNASGSININTGTDNKIGSINIGTGGVVIGDVPSPKTVSTKKKDTY